MCTLSRSTQVTHHGRASDNSLNHTLPHRGLTGIWSKLVVVLGTHTAADLSAKVASEGRGDGLRQALGAANRETGEGAHLLHLEAHTVDGLLELHVLLLLRLEDVLRPLSASQVLLEPLNFGLELPDLMSVLVFLHLVRVGQLFKLADLVLFVAHDVTEALGFFALGRVHLLDVGVGRASVLKGTLKAFNLSFQSRHRQGLGTFLAPAIMVIFLAEGQLLLSLVELELQVQDHAIVLGPSDIHTLAGLLELTLELGVLLLKFPELVMRGAKGRGRRGLEEGSVTIQTHTQENVG